MLDKGINKDQSKAALQMLRQKFLKSNGDIAAHNRDERPQTRRKTIILPASVFLVTVLSLCGEVFYPAKQLNVYAADPSYFDQWNRDLVQGDRGMPSLRMMTSDSAIDALTEEERDYNMLWQALALFSLILLSLVLWNRRLSREIRHRKKAETALSESEKRMRDILNNVGAYVFIKDAQYRYTYVNNKVCDLFGLQEQDILGKGDDAFFSSASVEEIMQSDRPVIERGETVDREEKELIAPDGLPRTYWTIKIPLRDNGGKIYGLCGISKDITEHKRAEEALHQSEKRFRLLVESSPDAIFVQTKGRFAYVNEAAVRLFGANAAEDLLGKPVLDFFHPDFHESVRERIRLLNEEKSSVPRIEEVFLQMDGAPIPGEVSAVPIHYEGNDGALVFVRDITERKRAAEEREKLQAQLNQAQKMESVGRLAGGVAHDFNNMLGIILGHTDMALDDVDPSQPLFTDLREIRKAAERSAQLTRQLLAFARKQTVAPKVLDLNETVEGMLKMLRRLIGEDIDLSWLPAAREGQVKIDPSQIDQILANLCINARDAIAGVGKITIETKNVVLDEAYCMDHAGFVPGEFVLLAISDDGCGMDKETLEKLFEPFFTTKELGKGTGLGLSTVYGIVKQNNGFINVYSEPGQGTAFNIYLPRHRDKAKPALEEVPAEPSDRCHETILLVEDEPSILNMTTKMLERLGYTVLASSTPDEAVRLAEAHSGDIHLLITDVVMPGMNGRVLAKNILTFHPNLKHLFMSGYTANVIAHHGVLDPGVNFIQKPFSRQDLSAKVREALGGSR